MVSQIVDFFSKNKEWIFSGAGVLVLGWIGNLIFGSKDKSDVQKVKAGDNSTVIQTRGDVTYTNSGKKDE